MLPQFGFTEFLFIAIIALIVVGPKDLPSMMRKLGQFVARGRAMAREFQSAFEDIARQSELEELRKEIEDLRRDNELTQAVDDLKRTEADINRQVMMENPMPDAGKGKEGPGAVPDAPDTPEDGPKPQTQADATVTPAAPDAPEPEAEAEPEPKKKAGSS